MFKTFLLPTSLISLFFSFPSSLYLFPRCRNFDVKLSLNCYTSSGFRQSRGVTDTILRVKNCIGVHHHGFAEGMALSWVPCGPPRRPCRGKLIGEEHCEHASPPWFCSRAFGAGINKRASILSTGIFVYLFDPRVRDLTQFYSRTFTRRRRLPACTRVARVDRFSRVI